MNAASLAGFALVFVVCAWTLSALGGAVLGVLRSQLARIGPLAERRAAVAVAVVPLVLALAVVGVLVAQSALGVDHCGGHGDHAHLCLVHGTLWTQLSWVVVILAVAGATLAARAVLVVVSFARGARSIRELRAVSRDAGAVRIVDSERAFCFVAGRGRPEVYVSSRAWAALTEPERAALVAHELAHVGHGDLRMREVLEGCLVFAAPLVGERVRATWLAASERVCDAHAAAVTGEPASVASAMVALCRIQASRPATSFAFTPAAGELAVRVEAVLANRPLGERAAVMLGRGVVAACGVLVVAAAAAADPLHHVFETLLG